MTARGIPFTKENAKGNGKKGGETSKRLPFDKRMQEWLQEEIKKGSGITIEEAARNALLRQVLKGNIPAIKELFNRAYGQSKQSVVLSGDDESPAIKVALERRKEITKRLMKSLKLDK